jgi:ParB-like chromosome segregation protein Spo0J
VPITRIVPNPQQHRTTYAPEGIIELAEVIRLHGQLQPITVEYVGDDNPYMLVYGERRWRAFQHLVSLPPRDDFDPRTYDLIRAEVRQVRADSPERTRRVHGLLENICRENPPARDVAAALHELRDDTKWSWEEIADYVGLSLARVQRLALLHGQSSVLDALEDGQINQNQAFSVGRLRDPDLAAELVPAISQLPSSLTKDVVDAARDVTAEDPQASATERARRAVARVEGSSAVGSVVGRVVSDSTRRERKSRPKALNVAFSWSTDSPKIEIHPRMLAATRVAHFPWITTEDWLDAMREDIAEYRDVCARHPDGAGLWSQLEEKLTPLLATADGL